jgi:hypothetical protein
MNGVIDQAAVLEHFNGVVHAKLEEAAQLPDAVQSFRCEDGHSFDRFVLAGNDNSALVVHDSDGRHRMSFGNSELPAYEVFVDEDGQLLVEFSGNDESLPDILQQIDLAASLPVSINELVPYGWRSDDDRITTVLYGSDFGKYEFNGMTVIAPGLDCFVLETEQLPEELRMEEDVAPWTDRLWTLIKTGRLVSLSERINNLTEELWAKSDGTDRGWLEFESSDGKTPAFVPNERYRFWHPRESFRGELFTGDRNGGKPYSRSLRNWFW